MCEPENSCAPSVRARPPLIKQSSLNALEEALSVAAGTAKDVCPIGWLVLILDSFQSGFRAAVEFLTPGSIARAGGGCCLSCGVGASGAVLAG
jgi:hypothetical protein